MSSISSLNLGEASVCYTVTDADREKETLKPRTWKLLHQVSDLNETIVTRCTSPRLMWREDELYMTATLQ